MAKRILFLMSDTGGGHRAAATAISAAMKLKYGEDAIQEKLVDVYRQCAFPLNKMPELYPFLVNRASKFYGWSFHSSNTRLGTAISSKWMYYTNRSRLRRMVRENPADVIVSVHSVITRPSMMAFKSFPSHPPFLTVVTDLVSTHRLWFDPHVERCLVPTQTAYDCGLKLGLSQTQLRLTGLPVHPKFSDSLLDKHEAREILGWSQDLPTVMMIGGGEGMGPLLANSLRINDAQLPCQLVIIAGKNKDLKAKLDAQAWNQPTHIYGYVDNMKEMPRIMAGSDILVTKAGPSTICEACIAGLPMILYDAIPGQEEGNVDFVVDNNIGVFAPVPEQLVAVLESWLSEGKEALDLRAERARQVARPDAVWQIAEEIWSYAHKT
ncbi:MAG: glycosyltransferase [Aggregatilineales bacterium]